MKILMVNKFLHPKGGAETYVFRLGEQLQKMGHEVQYFGMEHEGRIVGNRVNAYTCSMDFHGGPRLEKLTYSIRTIYSVEARRKIRLVLDDFQPDVCHLNNFNYQLTPSIILEIKKWSRQTGRVCKIVFTAHDCQLVCPNHLCSNPATNENCEKCFGGHYTNCIKGRCIHNSLAKSIVGAIEAWAWNKMGVYKNLDQIICCSNFLKKKIDSSLVLAEKTVVMHNFVEKTALSDISKKDYVIYFGRYSKEKGVETLLNVCKQLPHISFVFAGAGPLTDLIEGIPNVRNAGFQTGEALQRLIAEARFTVVPSECYENCPFSILESLMYGTPVLGADIGGIPELIKESVTGALFESGNAEELEGHISALWDEIVVQRNKVFAPEKARFFTAEEYAYCLVKDIYTNGEVKDYEEEFHGRFI